MQSGFTLSSIPANRKAFSPRSDKARLIERPAEISVVRKSGLLS